MKVFQPPFPNCVREPPVPFILLLLNINHQQCKNLTTPQYTRMMSQWTSVLTHCWREQAILETLLPDAMTLKPLANHKSQPKIFNSSVMRWNVALLETQEESLLGTDSNSILNWSKWERKKKMPRKANQNASCNLSPNSNQKHKKKRRWSYGQDKMLHPTWREIEWLR